MQAPRPKKSRHAAHYQFVTRNDPNKWDTNYCRDLLSRGGLDNDLYSDEEVLEVMANMQALYNKPALEIYRAIGLVSMDDLNLEEPGASWSSHRGAALVFGEENVRHGGIYLLTATIDRSAIDWSKAFELEFQYSDEAELPVDDQSKIVIKNVEKIRA